jgi:hypothetical protein
MWHSDAYENDFKYDSHNARSKTTPPNTTRGSQNLLALNAIRNLVGHKSEEI